MSHLINEKTRFLVKMENTVLASSHNDNIKVNYRTAIPDVNENLNSVSTPYYRKFY